MKNYLSNTRKVTASDLECPSRSFWLFQLISSNLQISRKLEHYSGNA